MPTAGGIAYANVNFPYAVEGKITLVTEGTLPAKTQVILADNYLFCRCYKYIIENGVCQVWNFREFEGESG